MPIIRVAIDVPVDTLFDYQAPDATGSDVGRRVLVPFGKKTAVGVILEISDVSEVPATRLKSALRVLRDMPPLAPEDLLSRLLQVERELGRVRNERWGPRNIDLDLLAFGDRNFKTSRLVLPLLDATGEVFSVISLARSARLHRARGVQRGMRPVRAHAGGRARTVL